MAITENKSPNQELRINSDEATLDQEDHIVTFTDAVSIRFEDFILNTNKIQLVYSPDKKKQEITEIIIPGKLTIRKNCSQDIIIANYAKFSNLTHKLDLSGNVIVQNEDRLIVTEKMTYENLFLKKISSK